MPTTMPSVRAAFAGVGLALRGGFHPRPEDQLPMAGDRPCRTLLLLGNVGPTMWQQFTRAPEHHHSCHPLDSWTRRVVDGLAAQFTATAVYPFDGPPHHPFQRWAMRCEPVHSSPLGLLIHPDFGLWHAYRAALLCADAIELPPREEHASPCDTCLGRPCLAACPVGAFSSAVGYDVGACTGHVTADAGVACRSDGCRARRACPIGADFTYGAQQQRFHMHHFIAAHTGA